MKLAQANGYIITTIQTFEDGTARIDVQRPGDVGRDDASEDLSKLV